MSITNPRGQTDEIVGEITGALKAYEADHSNSTIDLYRHNSVSVRVRIIDPTFRGLNRIDRHNLVWSYLNKAGEDAQSDISVLLLLTPEEKENSFANYDFDNPIPSDL
jgi:stress-induced morphogen